MPSLTSFMIVALGGALGSAFRYFVGTGVQTLSRSIDFPYGTLAVNLIGCFIIGANVILDLILVWLGRTAAYGIWS